jgi:hypothetical protein
MSEIYAGPVYAKKPENRVLSRDLPGLGDLEGYELVRLSIEQIDAELHLLAGPSAEVGVDLPALPQSVLDHGLATGSGDPRRDLFFFHLDLLEKLTAADFRLGKAYGLGRALADTSLLPRPMAPETFTKAFKPERIGTLTGWLDDLKGVFPSYAASATSHSLRAWVAWVAAPCIDGRPVHISGGGDKLTRALRAQGRLWRGLLSGERLGTDLLSVDDYVAAARAMVTHTARIAAHFFKAWRWWVVGVLLVLAGLLALIFAGLHGNSKTVTAIITILGALGLSWKGVSASLGKVVAKVEPHLWDAEVGAAVCQAATLLPERWPDSREQHAEAEEKTVSTPSGEST